MRLNCIITEPEPANIEVLEEFSKLIPDLSIVAKCNNSIETFLALQVQNVDLLFIDIEMPEVGGVDLIQCLKKAPLVIFTTGSTSASLALEAFELDAVDYLLKPVSFERFLKAMDKVYARLRVDRFAAPASLLNNHPANNFIFIKSDEGLTRVDYDSILYVEGLENYVKIFCETKMITSLSTMKAIEALLPSGNFLRIHRSFIVNMHKVENIKDGCFYIRNKEIMIGRSYKQIVLSILKNKYAVKIA